MSSAKRRRSGERVAGAERKFEDACELTFSRARAMHEWLEPLLSARFVSKDGFPPKAQLSAYAFKARLKPIYDIKSKVIAKRIHGGKPGYQPADVTDASGFRVVCLFNAEIPVALEAIFDLIEVPPADDAPARFADPPVREVIFYSSRPNGPLSIFGEVKELVTRRGYKDAFIDGSPRAGQPVSSYSSVHVIVKGEIRRASMPFAAFSEIQVRSVFEEAWGETSHRLKYAPVKRERAQSIAVAPEPDGVEGLWQHLDALKSLTDGCAQYADLINVQLLERRSLERPRNPKSTESPDESRKPFAVCTAAVRAAIDEAFEVERRAEALPPIDVTKAAFFLDAGQKFARAVSELESSNVPANDAERSRLANLLREEVGYCLYFSGDPEQVSAAEGIFEGLLRIDPSNEIVLIRLAQIIRDAGDFERARELLAKAFEASGAGRGAATNAQRAWLLRRDFAYVCWRLVDRQPQRPDAIELLERAVQLSYAAIDVAPGPDQRLNASMNLLYYLGDLHERLDAEKKESTARDGRALLGGLARKVDPNWSTEKLDTMMRAEHAFGRHSKAREYAAIVLERLNARVTAERLGQPISLASAFQALSPDERDMFLFAQQISTDAMAGS
jgi:ppGpp synthetase/RelA/SpoT-type nucleotidyltranferase